MLAPALPQAAASAPAPASASPAGSPALLRRLLSGRLGQAARLQLAAAWQAWGPVAYTAVAMAAVYLLWWGGGGGQGVGGLLCGGPGWGLAKRDLEA